MCRRYTKRETSGQMNGERVSLLMMMPRAVEQMFLLCFQFGTNAFCHRSTKMKRIAPSMDLPSREAWIRMNLSLWHQLSGHRVQHDLTLAEYQSTRCLPRRLCVQWRRRARSEVFSVVGLTWWDIRLKRCVLRRGSAHQRSIDHWLFDSANQS